MPLRVDVVALANPYISGRIVQVLPQHERKNCTLAKSSPFE